MRAFVIDAAAESPGSTPGSPSSSWSSSPPRTSRRSSAATSTSRSWPTSATARSRRRRTCARCRSRATSCWPSSRSARPSRGARRPARRAWLLDGTELEQHVIRRCRRVGFEPRFAGRLFSHEALLYAVQRGLGVTILPIVRGRPARHRPAAPARPTGVPRAARAPPRGGARPGARSRSRSTCSSRPPRHRQHTNRSALRNPRRRRLLRRVEHRLRRTVLGRPRRPA